MKWFGFFKNFFFITAVSTLVGVLFCVSSLKSFFAQKETFLISKKFLSIEVRKNIFSIIKDKNQAMLFKSSLKKIQRKWNRKNHQLITQLRLGKRNKKPIQDVILGTYLSLRKQFYLAMSTHPRVWVAKSTKPKMRARFLSQGRASHDRFKSTRSFLKRKHLKRGTLIASSGVLLSDGPSVFSKHFRSKQLTLKPHVAKQDKEGGLKKYQKTGVSFSLRALSKKPSFRFVQLRFSKPRFSKPRFSKPRFTKSGLVSFRREEVGFSKPSKVRTRSKKSFQSHINLKQVQKSLAHKVFSKPIFTQKASFHFLDAQSEDESIHTFRNDYPALDSQTFIFEHASQISARKMRVMPRASYRMSWDQVVDPNRVVLKNIQHGVLKKGNTTPRFQVISSRGVPSRGVPSRESALRVSIPQGVVALRRKTPRAKTGSKASRAKNRILLNKKKVLFQPKEDLAKRSKAASSALLASLKGIKNKGVKKLSKIQQDVARNPQKLLVSKKKTRFSLFEVFDGEAQALPAFEMRVFSYEGNRDSRHRWILFQVPSERNLTYVSTLHLVNWEQNAPLRHYAIVSENSLRYVEHRLGTRMQPRLGIVFGKVRADWDVKLTGRGVGPWYEKASSGERFFFFLNVEIGNQMLLVKKHQFGSDVLQGAVAVAVVPKVATFLDVSKPRVGTISGQVVAAERARARGIALVKVRVVGERLTEGFSNQKGIFKLSKVVRFGSYPLFLDADHLKWGYRHRVRIDSHQKWAWIPYFSPKTLSVWFRSIYKKVPPKMIHRVLAQTGLVVGAPNLVRRKLRASNQYRVRVHSFVSNLFWKPRVFSFSLGKELLENEPLEILSPVFLMTEVPKGPFLCQVQASKALSRAAKKPPRVVLWSELFFASPRVVYVLGGGFGRKHKPVWKRKKKKKMLLSTSEKDFVEQASAF